MENISVCIRIRPKVKEEDSPWKFENNTIYNMKSKDNFTFGKYIKFKNDKNFNSSLKFFR